MVRWKRRGDVLLVGQSLSSSAPRAIRSFMFVASPCHCAPFSRATTQQCSRACQTTHWTTHRPECREMVKKVHPLFLSLCMGKGVVGTRGTRGARHARNCGFFCLGSSLLWIVTALRKAYALRCRGGAIWGVAAHPLTSSFFPFFV